MLRGAFGSAFRNVACRPGCADSKTCEARDSCAYARTFEPILSGARPSGLSDPPRPFVFRAAHLDGSTIARYRFSFRRPFVFGERAESSILYSGVRPVGATGAGPGADAGSAGERGAIGSIGRPFEGPDCRDGRFAPLDPQSRRVARAREPCADQLCHAHRTEVRPAPGGTSGVWRSVRAGSRSPRHIERALRHSTLEFGLRSSWRAGRTSANDPLRVEACSSEPRIIENRTEAPAGRIYWRSGICGRAG